MVRRQVRPEPGRGTLNAYAQEGWRLSEAVTASFPGFFRQNREELIIILERDVPA